MQSLLDFVVHGIYECRSRYIRVSFTEYTVVVDSMFGVVHVILDFSSFLCICIIIMQREKGVDHVLHMGYPAVQIQVSPTGMVVASTTVDASVTALGSVQRNRLLMCVDLIATANHAGLENRSVIICQINL